MSFARYPEYKDSGVEWLGQVPEHWGHVRVKHLFVIGRGRVISLEDANEAGTYPVYSSQTTNDGCLGYIETFDFDCDQITWTTDGANAGTVFLRRGKHNCTNVCGTLQVKNDVEFNLVFALHYLTFATQFYKRPDTNGAKIMNGEMAEVAILAPSLLEQTQIAAFLDRETAKIDGLVAEQRRLMALLKEKRQAVISHAVTRGLNPDAPMKPSGIEWLGDVPAHWGVGSLGYQASIQTGSTPDRGRPEYWEGDIPWLKTGEINYERILDSEESITEVGLANSAARIADVGTLMMAMYGQGVTRGRVAILGIRAAYNQACAAITFGPKLFNEYAKYFFMMAYLFIRDTGNETSQMNLGSGTIAKIKILIPPLDEQRQIANFLQIELSVFDTLTTETQRAIELLQERRTALISAAVTGQIDVRTLA